MKIGFKKAFTTFKYLTIILTTVYWIAIIIDDWVFIEKYFSEHWFEYVSTWFVWFLIYFFAFSAFFWTTATIIIFTYFKIIDRIKTNDGNID